MSTSARVSSKRFIRINFFWMSETKGRNRENTNRGCRLSIALHPNKRMTVNRPWTCSPTSAVSATAAISADNVCKYSKAPFARASEADRNSRPRYSWLPHLYQEELSLGERAGKSERNIKCATSKKLLELERLQRDVLRGYQQLAGKCTLGRAAPQRLFRGQAHQVGIIVFLRDMRQHKIPRDRVESIGVGKIFAYGVIRKMPGAREHALLDDPWIRPDLEHIQIVIGFENQTVGSTKMHFDKLWHVAKIRDDGHLCAIRTKRESDGVRGVVRNSKRVNVNITDGKMLPRLNRFHALQPLPKCHRQHALHRIHGGLGDVQRRPPKPQHLRQAIAVVGVFVGNQDTVKLFDGSSSRRQPGKRFALAQSRIHQKAGPLGLKQSNVARAARRQNGYPQADRFLLNCGAIKFSK